MLEKLKEKLGWGGGYKSLRIFRSEREFIQYIRQLSALRMGDAVQFRRPPDGQKVLGFFIGWNVSHLIILSLNENRGMLAYRISPDNIYFD